MVKAAVALSCAALAPALALMRMPRMAVWMKWAAAARSTPSASSPASRARQRVGKELLGHLLGALGEGVDLGIALAEFGHRVHPQAAALPLAGVALYAMSKAAVAAMTRGLARDLGPRGITVNTVQPGLTETEIVSDEAVRAALRTMIPVGRMGRDSEIAGLVAWLAGPEAAYVNGAALTIDGGFVA
jgi:NAD(P)-dependent dehydrogenase (short-subunit alcohol dehydrogenase family)